MDCFRFSEFYGFYFGLDKVTAWNLVRSLIKNKEFFYSYYALQRGTIYSFVNGKIPTGDNPVGETSI